MKYNKYTIIAATAAIGLVSCEKENVFLNNEGEGMLNCQSLDVNYIGGGQQVRATEVNGVSVDDFTVNFMQKGCNSPEKTYIYADMPQVVTLPVGTYTIQALYGNNEDAAWDNPYYFGETGDITIAANKVTDVPGTVTCKLSNIKIKVNVDDNGLNLIQDYKVKLEVGTSSLEYNKDHAGQTAYFKCESGSKSIVASFTGTVDGHELTSPINVTYNNAAPGNAYTINFTVTKPENGKDGNISFGDSSLNIDTSVDVIDETFTANPDMPNDDIITNYDRDDDRDPSSNQ